MKSNQGSSLQSGTKSKKEQIKAKLQKKQKIKEPSLNLPDKPIVALTDDATFGKLVG